MTREQVIRSIEELAGLMREFADDQAELVSLCARMDNRVSQLRGHATAGRPDLKASLR